MAYSFAATTDRLVGSTTRIPASGSLALRFNPTWAQTDLVDHYFFSATNVGYGVETFEMRKFTDSNMYLGWWTGSTDYMVTVLSASYTINQNAWNTLVLTWDDSANESTAYLNGAQVGAKTASLVTHTTTVARTIGNNKASTANFAGTIADVGLWSGVLSAADVASYHAGNVCSQIRPDVLDDWWHIIRDAIDPVGGDALTVTGAAVAAHPRVYIQSGPAYDRTSVSAITYTSVGGIFLYTAANWGTGSAYFQATMRATSQVVYARLMDVTTSTAVANSRISTGSATLNRQRSSALTLTDGHEYRAQVGKAAPAAGECQDARLVVI